MIKKKNKAPKIPELRFPGFEDKKYKIVSLDKACRINPNNQNLPERFFYVDLDSVKNGQLLLKSKISREDAPSRAQRVLEKKDVLYQTVRPYQRNNYYFNLEGEFVASTGYAQIRAIQNSKFIYYYVHTDRFVGQVMNNSTGTSYPAINSGDLSKISIVIPDENEQQKIASFLTAVDKRIELLKKKKEKLEEYKKGMMQKIFSQEVRFKDKNGNDYPDWEEKRLGDILDYVQPTKYLVSNTEYNSAFETPVLTAGKTFILGYTNETKGIFNKDFPVIIFDDFTTSFQFVDFPFKVKSSALKILKNKNNATLIKFVYEAMKRIKFPIAEHKRYWISEYQNEKIVYPSIEEQQKIAEFLSSIDNVIEKVAEETENNIKFKKALLQKMFV